METKSKIVYTVIGCMSGPDYSKDDAYILGIFPDLQTAVDCLKQKLILLNLKKKELTLKVLDQ